MTSLTALAPRRTIRRIFDLPKEECAAMMFSKFAADFEKWLVRQKYAADTIDSYTFALRQFSAYLALRRVDDDVRAFTPEHVEGFAAEMDRRGAKASTITRRLSALSSLAVFGMKVPKGRGYLIDDDPTRRFDWPQTQEPETDYLYGAEMRALMELPVEPYKAVARDLLIETGLRASELCRANVGDLQDIGGERVLRVIVKGRRSRERKKSVPISDQLWAFLYEAISPARRGDPMAPILVGAHGRRLTRTDLGALVARMGREAGITRLRVHPHLFRHSLAVQLKLAGVHDRTASALLNQTDTRSLRRYDHIVPGELRAGREAANAARQRYVMPPPGSREESHDRITGND